MFNRSLSSFILLSTLISVSSFASEQKHDVEYSAHRNLAHLSVPDLREYILNLNAKIKTEDIAYLADPISRETMPLHLTAVYDFLPKEEQDKAKLFENLEACVSEYSEAKILNNSLMDVASHLMEQIKKTDESTHVHADLRDTTQEVAKKFKVGLGALQLMLGKPEGHLILCESYTADSFQHASAYMGHFAKYFSLAPDLSPSTYFFLAKEFVFHDLNRTAQENPDSFVQRDLENQKLVMEKFLKIAEDKLQWLTTPGAFTYYKAAYNKHSVSTFYLSNEAKERLARHMEWEGNNFNKAYAHYALELFKNYTMAIANGRHRSNYDDKDPKEAEADFIKASALMKELSQKMADATFQDASEKVSFLAEAKNHYSKYEEGLNDPNHWIWQEFGHVLKKRDQIKELKRFTR